MTPRPDSLRELIESGPLAHLSTINADGSPQVTVIWIGPDGDQIVSGHTSHHLKLRNIERDPRVALSFEAPRVRAEGLSPYEVVKATATVQPSDDTWDLLNRLAKVYAQSDVEFGAPRGPGYVARYDVQRISGVGPWVAKGRARPITTIECSSRGDRVERPVIS